MSAPQVETATGRIAGRRATAPGGEGLAVFLGVPYAAPPVGDRRWQAPAPAEPWTGVRDAVAFGPAAPQAAGVASRLPSFSVEPWSEDCLTLNVWTPGTDGRRPVMVWIHGGAYLGGGTAMGAFDGARLAAEGDVVVVTVNYRLGALGYLRTDPDTDPDGTVGNCGLRDQAAALEWVRTHASAFAGDPTNVTVFGESAGGGSVLHLCTATRRAPFRRAIVQSGEPRTLTVELAQRVRDAYLNALGVAPGGPDALAGLQAVPVEVLLAAQDAVVAELAIPTGMMPFHPTYDDDLVDVDPIGGFGAGRARDVDLLIGNCRDELSLWRDPRARDLDDAALLDMLGRLGGGRVDPARVLAAYRAERPDRPAADVWEAARTDAVLRVPALKAADAHGAAGGRVFVYRFDWEAPEIGAAHAVDVPFTFGTFDRDGWGAAVGADARPAAADALGRTMRDAWRGFAATGDPAATGAGDWPAYDSVTRPTRLLDAECSVGGDPAGAARAVWME